MAEAQDEVLIKFAQKLAGNEKKYRDRALKKFKKWLTLKCQGGLCDEEFQKIWKGLHYCMWMSDKPLVQEDLASQLASLVHLFTSPSVALDFVNAFFITEAREWNSIDSFRLDKFMMLIRCYLRQTLVLLQNHEWSEELIQQLLTALSGTVISYDNDRVPDGLRFHVANMYWDELERTGAQQLTSDQVFEFLKPYSTLLCNTKNDRLQQHVVRRIFEPPLQWAKEQSDSDAEEKEKEDTEEDGQEENEKVIRCKVSLKQVEEHLFELAGGKDTCLSRNRGQVYKLVKRYRLARQGDLPDPLEGLPTHQQLAADPVNKEMKQAALRLQKFEVKMLELNVDRKTKRQNKKLRKRQAKEALDDDLDEEDEGQLEEDSDVPPSPPAKKKRKSEGKSSEKEAEKDESLQNNKGDEAIKTPKISKPVHEAEKKSTGKKKKQKESGMEEAVSPQTRAKLEGISLSGNLYDSDGDSEEKENTVNSSMLAGKNEDKKNKKKVSESKANLRKSLESGLASENLAKTSVKDKSMKRKSLESGLARKEQENLMSIVEQKVGRTKGNRKSAGKKNEKSSDVGLFSGGFIDNDEETSEEITQVKDTSTAASQTKTKQKKNKSLEIKETGETVILNSSINVTNQTPDTKTNKTTLNSSSVSDKESVTPSSKKEKKKRKSGSGHYFSEDNTAATTEATSSETSTPTVSNEAVTEDGEIEIWIPNKKYKGSAATPNSGKKSKGQEFASFEKLQKTPPAFVRRAISKVSPKTEPKKVTQLKEGGAPGSAPDSKKRVSFIMARNTAQDFEDSFTQSPKPAFNPLILPETGILKGSPANSPATQNTPKQKLAFKEKRRSKAADFF